MNQGSDHNLHDLTEFAFAREVVKDHPRIISIYKKLLPVLYAFAHYQCVWPVLTMIEDSKLLAEMQLAHYTKVYTSKGLLKNGKK